ncbi:MAG: class II aldolase/adducin family protein [Pseudonocardia sp.]|nr:class II aldolase/adducin family protein [Pseudonocardia sp.]
MHFAMIRSSDLVRVDEDGQVVEGDRAVNGAAVAIHCAVHAAAAGSTRTRRRRGWVAHLAGSATTRPS